jgi:hypothetical protein
MWPVFDCSMGRSLHATRCRLVSARTVPHALLRSMSQSLHVTVNRVALPSEPFSDGRKRRFRASLNAGRRRQVKLIGVAAAARRPGGQGSSRGGARCRRHLWTELPPGQKQIESAGVMACDCMQSPSLKGAGGRKARQTSAPRTRPKLRLGWRQSVAAAAAAAAMHQRAEEERFALRTQAKFQCSTAAAASTRLRSIVT